METRRGVFRRTHGHISWVNRAQPRSRCGCSLEGKIESSGSFLPTCQRPSFSRTSTDPSLKNLGPIGLVPVFPLDTRNLPTKEPGNLRNGHPSRLRSSSCLTLGDIVSLVPSPTSVHRSSHLSFNCTSIFNLINLHVYV